MYPQYPDPHLALFSELEQSEGSLPQISYNSNLVVSTGSVGTSSDGVGEGVSSSVISAFSISFYFCTAVLSPPAIFFICIGFKIVER